MCMHISIYVHMCACISASKYEYVINLCKHVHREYLTHYSNGLCQEINNQNLHTKNSSLKIQISTENSRTYGASPVDDIFQFLVLKLWISD